MIKILIVEDEEPISNLIRMSLTKAGYHCEQAFDGESAADAIEGGYYDLILLDIMLPGINGYELLEYIKTKEIPVIFITAMGDLDDRVKGLRAGAEDYITKPFEMLEVQARIETVLRRYHKMEDKIEIFDTTIDLSSRTVMQGGKQIMLTWKEFELLLFLCAIKTLPYTAKRYMKIYGTAIIWETAARLICMSRDYGKN